MAFDLNICHVSAPPPPHTHTPKPTKRAQIPIRQFSYSYELLISHQTLTILNCWHSFIIEHVVGL